MPTVVIAAGGTAGHVVPALAVAGELRDRGARIVWAGTPGRAEADLVPRAGYQIEFFPVTGIDRRNPLRAGAAAFRAARAVPAARSFLRRIGADVVLGGGGYVAGPVGLAAALGRTPLVLTEADSRLGLANRLLARYAERVCLAFPIPGQAGAKYLVTGRPVPSEVPAADRATARARLGIDAAARCLVVFGGSLGARNLNLAAVEAFGRADGPWVVHITGRRDHEEVAAALRARGEPPRYRLFEYFDTLADPLAASDLVLARAGGSIAEVTAAGRPAVLVPYPHATADHQTSNARWMADAGAAVVIPDAELAPARLRQEIGGLLGDEDRLAAMTDASRALARPDAAARVADEVLAAARTPRPAAGRPPDRDRPWAGRRLHFVGIGGAGMSGLALVAARLGAEVSGCDRAESPYMRKLRDAGIEPIIGHDPAHGEPGLELVASTAVTDAEPELTEAIGRGATVMRRGPLLAEIAALRRVIAVSGAHGKTTTTAMLAAALESCGLDPGYLVGAELRSGDGAHAANARWGGGEWIVVEADESDRSFLALAPEIAVVTSIELDHHTTYSSELELEKAFADFLERVPEGGTAVVWEGAPVEVPAGRERVTYGLGPGPGLRALAVDPAGTGVRFALQRDGEPVCTVELPVPGEHNVLNALAALGAAEAVGCALEQAARALAAFRPAARRFEPVGTRDGALVFDDYAHHPTEVEATLQAARGLAPERLIAVFQPHLYSRTLHLHREFGRALALADEVVVLDVYPARERPEGALAGVTGKLVADATADRAGGRTVWWLPSIEDARTMLGRHLGRGDLLITLGAGDVDRLARELVEPV
jgi:UDP-N-acetylmuramate--alanine ligase